MDNIILETLRTLALVLATLAFISMAVIQYLKETWGIEGQAAEVLSLVVGFVLAGLVVVSYLDQMAWHISVSQGIGVFLFVVVGTISPSGGYKTLRELLGSSNDG